MIVIRTRAAVKNSWPTPVREHSSLHLVRTEKHAHKEQAHMGPCKSSVLDYGGSLLYIFCEPGSYNSGRVMYC